MAVRIKERVLAEKMDVMRKVKNLPPKALEKVELLVSFRSLNKVNSHYYCAMCDLSSEAALDDYIQVTFTVSAEVPEIACHHPESLSVEDYHMKYHFNPGASLPGGPRFIDARPSMVKGLSYVSPGQKKRFSFDTAGGNITLNDLIHHLGAVVTLKGDPSDKPQALTVRLEPGKLVVDRAELAPGRIVVAVDNRTAARASMLILNLPPGFEKKHLVFEPFPFRKETDLPADLSGAVQLRGRPGVGGDRRS